MASEKIIRKYYQPPAGLDLRSSMMERSPNSASSMKNVDFIYTEDGDVLTQCRGWENLTPWIYAQMTVVGITGLDYLCLLKYERIDPDTGVSYVETLAINRHLFRIQPSSITLFYAGAGVATVEILAEALTHRIFTLRVNGVSVFSHDLFDASYNELFELRAAVNAIADFSLAISTPDLTVPPPASQAYQRRAYAAGGPQTGTTFTVDDGVGGNHNLLLGMQVFFYNTGSVLQARKITNVTPTTISFNGASITVADNAEFLPLIAHYESFNLVITPSKTVSATGTTITIYEEESVVEPEFYTYPFLSLWNTRRSSGFILPSYVNVNNVLYISDFTQTNFPMLKYDGQNLYPPGVPKGGTPGLAAGGAGNVDAGVHKYIVTCVQEDAQGNIVEGPASEESSVTLGVNSTVTITFTPPSFLFHLPYRKYALAVGNQVGVNTINVDEGAGGDHLLDVGDKVFFYNGVSSSYITRTVTSATYPGTGGTITIDGAAVNVVDNTIFSPNSKYAIYRTYAGGQNFHLVAEIPWSAGGYASWIDNISDANLGAQYLWPETNEEHTAPIGKGGYLALHQGSLIFGGGPTSPNTIHPSVPGSPEYFPDTLSTQIVSGTGQQVSGLVSNGANFLVFMKDSTHLISGQILDPYTIQPNYRVDVLSGSVGCMSHKTIQDIEGSIVFLSRKGLMIQSGSQVPQLISNEISPIFTAVSTDISAQLNLSRAVGCYVPREKKYLLFIPAHTNYGGTYYLDRANDNSRCLVYDIERQAWREWTNINFLGGCVVYGDVDIKFLRRWQTADSSAIDVLLIGRFLYTETDNDLSENNVAIPWEVVSGWETLNEPSVNKKWLSTKAYAPGGVTRDFTLGVETQKNWESTAHTQAFVTFGSDTTMKRIKLLPTKAYALRHKFTHNTVNKRVKFLGWENEIVTPYKTKMTTDE